MISEAEKILGKERVEYERSKYREKPRSRLTLEDFTSLGINVPQELWDCVQAIEEPVPKLKMFLEVLNFVLPKITAIDIQHEINTTGTTKLDLSSIDPLKLVALLRQEKGED